MSLNGLSVINFSANDYLGLANHPEIVQSVKNAHDLGYGAGAAHLVSGHHLQHHLLEDELADWLGFERVCLFSTGYMANLAVLQALTQKGDLILGDKLNHASLIDGALHASADFKRYPHVDLTSLEKRLQTANNAQQATLIATDAVFSMDGDIAPLDKIINLAKRYDAWVYLDDAHGIGVLGEQGRGSLSHFDIAPAKELIYMGTLGKAFGCFGAFVAASNTVIEALIQLARPYIYTTAMPPVNALAARTALKLIHTRPELNQTLKHNIQLFKTLSAEAGLPLMPSDTAIQPLIIGDSARAMQISDQLKKEGFWVAAIRPPTVPKNTSRLRITLSASHTETQIHSLVTHLSKTLKSLSSE